MFDHLHYLVVSIKVTHHIVFRGSECQLSRVIEDCETSLMRLVLDFRLRQSSHLEGEPYPKSVTIQCSNHLTLCYQSLDFARFSTQGERIAVCMRPKVR